MAADQLQQRIKRFSLQIIQFFQALPKSEEAQILGNQLLRSATSVTADEPLLWLEMNQESKIGTNPLIDQLKQESKELLYIFSASRKSAKGRE